MPEPQTTGPRVLMAIYSRGGRTRRAAVRVAERIEADIVEIRPRDDPFKGLFGLARAVSTARRGEPCAILPVAAHLAAYDLVVVATPIWANHIAPPVRAFLAENRALIADYATLYTCAGLGEPEAGEDMARIMGPSPRAVLDLTWRDDGRPSGAAKIDAFVRELWLG